MVHEAQLKVAIEPIADLGSVIPGLEKIGRDFHYLDRSRAVTSYVNVGYHQECFHSANVGGVNSFTISLKPSLSEYDFKFPEDAAFFRAVRGDEHGPVELVEVKGRLQDVDGLFELQLHTILVTLDIMKPGAKEQHVSMPSALLPKSMRELCADPLLLLKYRSAILFDGVFKQETHIYHKHFGSQNSVLIWPETIHHSGVHRQRCHPRILLDGQIAPERFRKDGAFVFAALKVCEGAVPATQTGI
jgi:hypothetical protein